MQPANSSPISDIISQLQHSNSKSDFERAKFDLNFRESQLQREKHEISRQLQNSLKDNSILSKQIQQWKKEHGALQLLQHESQQELIKLRQEKEEFEMKSTISAKENEILKKQLGNLGQENGELVGRIGALETEIRVLKGEKIKIVEDKGEMEKREKEARVMCEKLKEELVRVEKCKNAEVERTIEKKNKVEGNYEALMIAATDRYKELEIRVKMLEEFVEAISAEEVQHNAEAEEQRNEGLVECPSVLEATVRGSSPCTHEFVPAPPPIFELTDSDDEEDLPFMEGTKRKLFSSPGDSDEKEESANSGTNRSKQLKASGDGSVNASMPLTSKSTENLVALKQCENKSGVELAGKHQGLSARSVVNDSKDGIQDESGHSDNWEYEADLLDALGKDTELCMEAVCALYRRQTAKGRLIAGPVSGYRGFTTHSTLRITVLAKLLSNGDEQGRLRRSVSELERLNPKAALECRSIACAHVAQLFEIYQKKTDPFFGHGPA